MIMSLVQRENLITAMITGKKPMKHHAGRANAERPTLVGILMAVVVLAGTVYGILRYDPQAFTLRPGSVRSNGNHGRRRSRRALNSKTRTDPRTPAMGGRQT